ncbi:hypothetical protein LOKO_01630 [Halomonas chromatireducens]|uniref:Uncharacterized protein n=1 Tax=Halomonas chromatireducens TaxID=507626 RepID=A0A109ULL6_9GAMM|nr:hypothetical protein LOKO_01630 [Halomonas chromatireducens]
MYSASRSSSGKAVAASLNSSSIRCDVKNLVTSGVGVNDGFKDAWLDR